MLQRPVGILGISNAIELHASLFQTFELPKVSIKENTFTSFKVSYLRKGSCMIEDIFRLPVLKT